MVYIGLLVGLFSGVLIGRDSWFFCAAVGTLLGWLIDRVNSLSAEVKKLDKRTAYVEKMAADPAAAFKSQAADTLGNAPSVPEPKAEAPMAPPITEVVASATLPDSLAVVPPQSLESAVIQSSPAVPSGTGYEPPPTEPNFIIKLLLGGNTVVRVGVVILFFGVAFLLKFAYEHSHVPVEVRLIGVSLSAMALLFFGWRLRNRRPGYALSLQGGGVGLLYLTIFAAFRLYSVLPPGPAFALLVLVAAFSALLAVWQDSLALAAAGVTGGFLAPILASTGQGSHVMLFSYYVVLNLGIAAVAWKKAWRVLNILGFVFTFVIGLFWGGRDYRPEFFSSTEPFLAIFFLLYVLIPILFARRAAERHVPYVDGTLVFGVPLVAFGLQSALVREFEFGAAWSAFGLGAFYLVLASILWKRAGEGMRLLTESYLALGSGFATLAIPLAFDGRTTSAAWALEGAAVVWVGSRQNRFVARLVGYALQFAAGVSFLVDIDKPVGNLPILNSLYLGCVLIAFGAWFCSVYVSRGNDGFRPAERIVPALMLVWGAVWWVGGGVQEIHRHADHALLAHGVLIYLAASAAVMSVLSRTLPWPIARWAAYSLLPAMLLILVRDFVQSQHPFANLGYLAWPVAFAVHLWVMRGQEARDSRVQGLLHSAGLWIFAIVASWEISWQINAAVGGKAVWPLIAFGLVPGTLLALLNAGPVRKCWPVAAHESSYLVAGAIPIAIYLVFWTSWANFSSDGDPAPLPYVPLLNPLDLAHGFVFFSLAHWLLRLRRDGYDGELKNNYAQILEVGGVAAFVWANGVLLRTLHHWASVPFRITDMFHSVVVQAAVSLFWTMLALGLMTIATRRSLRSLWLIGAILMGVVVVKLFAIDLSNIGGIERIVSFIGVGALMLVIGYFAPVPPRVGVPSGGSAK